MPYYSSRMKNNEKTPSKIKLTFLKNVRNQICDNILLISDSNYKFEFINNCFME